MVGCNSGRATPFLRRNRPSAIPNHQPRRNATYHSREAVQTTEASSLLAIDRDYLEGISVDVKYMVAVIFVDDGPFLNCAQHNTLIDAIGVEATAADEESKFLVVGGGRKFGLLDRQRQSPRVGDLLIADGSERRSTKRGGERHRKRLTFDDDSGKRSDGRGVTLVIGY